MLHSKPAGFWVFMALAGMITGTVVGEVLGSVLPDSSATLRTFFSGSLDLSLGPVRFDIVVLRFGLREIGVRLNVMSFAGLVLVGYLYRWF
jgi:hypothetical protein